MRILFLIGYFNKNNGGHFHSLHHISNEMAIENEVKIVSVGSPIETVVNTNKNFHSHINFNGKNWIFLYKSLQKIKNEFNPDVVHSFGKHGYDLWKIIFGKDKPAMVVNICGGPNPKVFPVVENLVLFSKENMQWFENQIKYAGTNKYLIPNRVSKVELLENRILQKETGGFNFVRISRIGPYYKKSLIDTITLVKKLQKDQINCRLYIIGFIEDEGVYETLSKLASQSDDILFLTDKKFTDNASKMLYLADAVVATGRSFMEAASLGLPVLTPIKNAEIPLLVNNDNFDEVFKTNFSERNEVSDGSNKKNYQNIKNIILDKNVYGLTSQNTKLLFESYFDLLKAKEKYEMVYRNAIESPQRLSRFFDLKSKLNTVYKSIKYYKSSNG